MNSLKHLTPLTIADTFSIILRTENINALAKETDSKIECFISLLRKIGATNSFPLLVSVFSALNFQRYV